MKSDSASIDEDFVKRNRDMYRVWKGWRTIFFFYEDGKYYNEFLGGLKWPSREKVNCGSAGRGSN